MEEPLLEGTLPACGRTTWSDILTLEEQLRQAELAVEKRGTDKVPVRDFLMLLGEADYAFLILICNMPFLQPIPLSGLSTLLGALIIALSWLQLRKPGRAHLPKRVAEREIPVRVIRLSLAAARRFVALLQRLPTHRLAAGGWSLLPLCNIVFGALLMLPLPIPFSNALPAAGIFLTCAFMLSRQTVVLVMAMTLLMLNVVAFGGLAVTGVSLAGDLMTEFRENSGEKPH